MRGGSETRPRGESMPTALPPSGGGEGGRPSGIRTWNSGMAASGALVLPRDARVGAKAMAESMTLTRRLARPAGRGDSLPPSRRPEELPEPTLFVGLYTHGSLPSVDELTESEFV